MKKYLLLAPLMASSAVALADGSVTLYGKIDTGLQFQSGLPKGSQVAAQSRSAPEPARMSELVRAKPHQQLGVL